MEEAIEFHFDAMKEENLIIPEPNTHARSVEVPRRKLSPTIFRFKFDPLPTLLTLDFVDRTYLDLTTRFQDGPQLFQLHWYADVIVHTSLEAFLFHFRKNTSRDGNNPRSILPASADLTCGF